MTDGVQGHTSNTPLIGVLLWPTFFLKDLETFCPRIIVERPLNSLCANFEVTSIKGDRVACHNVYFQLLLAVCRRLKLGQAGQLHLMLFINYFWLSHRRPDYGLSQRLILTMSGCKWTFRIGPGWTTWLNVIYRLILAVILTSRLWPGRADVISTRIGCPKTLLAQWDSGPGRNEPLVSP